MAIAGRVLIIPRGDYDGETTYNMLDLVSYNASSWLCRKTCVGLVPSANNKEYWFKMGSIALANNLETSEMGFALDARQGRLLNQSMASLESDFAVIETTVTNLTATVNGLMGTNIAEEYDSTATYTVGQYVTYNNDLYVCITAITVPETFTVEHWKHCYIMQEIDDKVNQIVEEIVNTEVASQISDLTTSVTNLTTKVDGAIVASNEKVFDFEYDAETESYGFNIDGEFHPFSNASELYDALKFSGLVTEGMTYQQMLDALKAKFPAIVNLMQDSSITTSYEEVKNGSSTTANEHSESATSAKISFVNRCGASYEHKQHATFDKRYSVNSGSRVSITASLGNKPERDSSTGGWDPVKIYLQFSADGTTWESVELYNSATDGFPYSSNGVLTTKDITTEKTIAKRYENCYVRLYAYAKHTSYQGYLYIDVTNISFKFAG